jgi:hypothetical protein
MAHSVPARVAIYPRELTRRRAADDNILMAIPRIASAASTRRLDAGGWLSLSILSSFWHEPHRPRQACPMSGVAAE